MASSCTGQCCVAFPLNVEQERMPLELADMLVPISTEEAFARHERFYGGWGACVPTGGPSDGQYYRCVHWDEEIYEDRPQMCRDFPGYGDGAACEYGCDCQDRHADA